MKTSFLFVFLFLCLLPFCLGFSDETITLTATIQNLSGEFTSAFIEAADDGLDVYDSYHFPFPNSSLEFYSLVESSRIATDYRPLPDFNKNTSYALFLNHSENASLLFSIVSTIPSTYEFYITQGSTRSRIINFLVLNSSSPESFTLEIIAPCKSSWSCTDYSSCTDEKKTRTCTDRFACGTDEGKPIEEKDCNEDDDDDDDSRIGGSIRNSELQCQNNWKCTDWGDCINGFEKRECKDENSCLFLITPKPSEEQSCTSSSVSSSTSSSSSDSSTRSAATTSNSTLTVQEKSSSDDIIENDTMVASVQSIVEEESGSVEGSFSGVDVLFVAAFVLLLLFGAFLFFVD